jgi:hypothetical protein
MSPKPRVASRRLGLVASGRKLAFGHGRLARFVLPLRFAQVFGGGRRDDGIITHEAERGVARMAKEPAHLAAGMTMIDEQRPRRLGLADAAPTCHPSARDSSLASAMEITVYPHSGA